MFTTVGDFNKWPLVEVLSNPSESIDYTLSQNNMAMKYPPFPEDVQHLALAVGVQRPPEWYVDDLAATTTKKTLHTTHTDQKLATFLYDFPIQIFIKQANPKKTVPPKKKKPTTTTPHPPMQPKNCNLSRFMCNIFNTKP